MLKIGDFQKLKVDRIKPQGYYLKDEEGNEVLLPNSSAKERLSVGQETEVFIYLDSEDLEIATMEQPLIKVGQCAYLLVKDVSRIGAFCDIGLSRDLLVPFRNMAKSMEAGKRYVVFMYLDKISDRLVGSSKLKSHISPIATDDIEKGQKVEILICQRTEVGYKVVINNSCFGMIYFNEINERIEIGQTKTAYIKPIREDGKIDVSLNPIGHQSIEPTALKILKRLERNNGFLPFTDKSDPDLIRNEFGISKKLFKKSIGNLYRQRLILIKKDGIHKI